MTRLRVLMVEDSEDDAILVDRELRRGGYDTVFCRVQTREDLHKALESNDWDLVITDHNMPSFSSAAALAVVQGSGLDVPVIIVSGSIGEEIAVAAMKTGAHDYVMKDNLARLVPAVERELREAKSRGARRQAEATIRHLAYHDALTGLGNRHQFERSLAKAVDEVHEQGVHHALLYIDLDQFKIVNDTCGHTAGDQLLKQLAVVLQDSLRDSDTLARLGGDEFGLVLHGATGKQARRIAEKLLSVIKSFRFSWQGKTFVVGASIGVVEITTRYREPSDVLVAADMACYAAKERGRSQIHVYREDDSELARRHGEMQWVASIPEALENNRFTLYYQPIVPLGSKGHNGSRFLEILVRMVSDDGRLVLPGAFIPAAERYNLMPSVDRWIIENALRAVSEAGGNYFAQDTQLTAFVNLSGASLSDETLYAFIRDQMHRYQVSPENVCFEITETAAIADLPTALKFINAIKNEGCLVALDDFGSGLSSFSYLRTIPADFIKIDGAFVREMLVDPMSAAIVESIHRIARVAGLRTIAEHVEDDEVRAHLATMGIDFAQGYAIANPEVLEPKVARAKLAVS